MYSTAKDMEQPKVHYSDAQMSDAGPSNLEMESPMDTGVAHDAKEGGKIARFDQRAKPANSE